MPHTSLLEKLSCPSSNFAANLIFEDIWIDLPSRLPPRLCYRLYSPVSNFTKHAEDMVKGDRVGKDLQH